jgi:hypothetical protein
LGDSLTAGPDGLDQEALFGEALAQFALGFSLGHLLVDFPPGVRVLERPFSHAQLELLRD